MSLRDWIQAARPRTLPLASACVMVGGAVAYESLSTAETDQFWLPFTMVLATVMMLQVLSNWANDLGDFENGADDASREDRAVASGRISSKAMKRAAMVLGFMTFLTGLGTVFISLRDSGKFWIALSLIGLGIGAIAAAYRYTAGKNPYGYKGWGDAMVFLFFGWIGVLGSAYLLSHQWSWAWLGPATWSGCLSVMVLNLNNMRDQISDASSGKRTLVVAWGWSNAKIYHVILFFAGWLGWWVFALWIDAGSWRGMGWIAIINFVQLAHVWRVWKCEDPKLLDGELKKVALTTAVAALFFLMAQTGLK